MVIQDHWRRNLARNKLVCFSNKRGACLRHGHFKSGADAYYGTGSKSSVTVRITQRTYNICSSKEGSFLAFRVNI